MSENFAAMSKTDVSEAFAMGDAIDIRELAAPYRENAMKTLDKVTRARRAPSSAKVSAARAILEFSDGKPNAIPDRHTSGGVHIHINRLYCGNEGADVVDAVIDLVDQAEVIEGQVVIQEATP